MTETHVYVRYCETDAAGHVNNTSYFYYFEEGRMKFFETIGFKSGERAVDFIVARTECDFLAQSYAGQTLSVTTDVANIGTKSYQISHEIKNHDTGELIAKGSAVIVCFDFESQQTVNIPTHLREQLIGHMKAVKEV